MKVSKINTVASYQSLKCVGKIILILVHEEGFERVVLYMVVLFLVVGFSPSYYTELCFCCCFDV